MLSYFGSSKRNEQIRTLLTRTLPYSPVHRRWLRRMSAVLTTNTETLDLARLAGSKNASMYFDPGLPESYLASTHRVFTDTPRPLRLIWVGRMLPRKALALTLDILAKVRSPFTLLIVGGGMAQEVLAELIESRGLEGRVALSPGEIPWQEVRAAYGQHDALLFTSLRDSCAAQLLEAMASGLPVITLDLHGGGAMVPGAAGIKIPVSDVEGTIQAGAEAVERYADLSGTERTLMSEAALNFARTMTWPVRARFAQELYHRVLGRRSV
jgi:glycosyltransferase involved in cell wall biosynthesis